MGGCGPVMERGGAFLLKDKTGASGRSAALFEGKVCLCASGLFAQTSGPIRNRDVYDTAQCAM